MTKFLIFLKQYTVISAGILALLVGSAAWALLVRPASLQLAENRLALSTRQAERDMLEQDRAAFERLQSETQKLSPEVSEKISRILPKGRDVPRLIVELEALASEAGVLLKDVNLAEGSSSIETKLPKGVKPIGLVVTIAGGDYATLKRFLSVVEKNARLLDVQSFTFSKGLQAYTINLTAYYTE